MYSHTYPTTGMDETIQRLILMRLRADQLMTIRFGGATSLRTIALMLHRQQAVKELALGDVGLYDDILDGCYVPPIFYETIQSQIATLEVGDIMRGAASTVLNIIHLSSSTLKRLRLGNPSHEPPSRFPPWKAEATDFYNGKDEDFLTFSTIPLPVLEQLHIVHDHQFSSLGGILAELIRGCTKLTHIKLSGCTMAYKLVSSLVRAGADRIESLQICQCREANSFQYKLESLFNPNSGPPEAPCSSLWYNLPQMGSLHTLQLTSHGDPDDDQPFTCSFANRRKIKRMWVGCQNLGRDPTKCPATRALFNPSTLGGAVVFSENNWPLLEELVIPHPGDLICDLLAFPSMKVTRLLEWRTICNPRQKRAGNPQRQDIDIVAEVEDLLKNYYDSPDRKPLPPRLLVVEKSRCYNYCTRDTTLIPCYLAVKVDRNLIELDSEDGSNGFTPTVRPVDKDRAFNICRKLGCSTFLLGAGPPSPERFWEDAYAFTKKLC
ncbi:hypothetical protein TWF281_009731 [Arthrobotrys megalospora]